MSLLTKIAKTLHDFGRAQDPSAVTRVSFDLSCNLSDLELPSESASSPSMEWTLKTTLTGLGTYEEGVFRPWAFDQSWSGLGDSEHESVVSVWQMIQITLQGYLDAQSKSVTIVSELLREMDDGKLAVDPVRLKLYRQAYSKPMAEGTLGLYDELPFPPLKVASSDIESSDEGTRL